MTGSFRDVEGAVSRKSIGTQFWQGGNTPTADGRPYYEEEIGFTSFTTAYAYYHPTCLGIGQRRLFTDSSSPWVSFMAKPRIQMPIE